jgi:hypothetical protein
VLVDVKGRRLRPREFWNRATNTLRYVAEDAEAKQVQEAFDGANQDAEPDRLKDDDRRGNRPTGGGGETNQVAEEARGEPARLGLSGQPAAERSRQEGVAPAQVADEPAFELRRQTLDQIITAEEAAAADEAKAAREKKAGEEAVLATAHRRRW